MQQIPRQDRLRPRQAARLCRARRAARRGLSRAKAGELHLRRRQGERGAVSRATVFIASPICSDVSEIELFRRYGEEGRRLARLARGIDDRTVSADRETKSVSSETTFERDLSDFRSLEQILWGLTEEVSARLKAKDLAGATVTLKLKTADFKIRTRARSLDSPTQLAGRIFAAARDLLSARPTARASG